MSTLAATDVLVRDVVEDAIRELAAERVRLSRMPATHGLRAEQVAEFDVLLDQWLRLR